MGLASFLTTIIFATVVPQVEASASAGNLTVGDRYSASISSPPRLQWNANQGYCGEVSFITSLLRLGGGYASQYDVRALASNGTNQSKATSQLLLGVNDYWAAAQMHMKAAQWDNSAGPNAIGFLLWVKNAILNGASPIIAIYTNEWLFYSKTNPSAGQSTYDHIVPVIEVSSDFPLSASNEMYHPNDTITFSDNGLWAPHGNPTYIWQYADGPFQATRQQANSQSAAVYSLPDSVKQYGIIITGIIDNDGQTLPVQVATDLNYEKPSIENGSNQRPAPENLTLTITVSGLNSGQDYNLYRYGSFASVPNQSFNAQHANAAKSWQITGKSSTYTFSETILSDQIAVYRAVPVTAP